MSLPCPNSCKTRPTTPCSLVNGISVYGKRRTPQPGGLIGPLPSYPDVTITGHGSRSSTSPAASSSGYRHCILKMECGLRCESMPFLLPLRPSIQIPIRSKS